jgi:large subunit ribosomal protein L4
MAETKKTKTTKEEKVKLNPLVWELPYNEDLVVQVLYVYNSNERKGTVRQKGRGDVSGGGKKPWRQKGTGRARHGSIRSPLWIGGGVTFPSKDRNFKKKINKKMVKKATRIMLSERLRNNELDFVKLTPAKSKKLREERAKGNLVITEDEKIVQSLRNVQRFSVVSPQKLNAKHLVSARKILVDEGSIKILENRLIDEK